ncbi:unnamed protein product [Lepeophtheirus salmonis]|uniref:(salmon louse) hypothetical protein n=1 Tax=Lepeophtheirus salmonis TaxID=72036 RepID=A0A7R8D1Y7_LEPSM|nr:unnamed protein product [Lepeophtheirus salmonis]CAF2999423.1 unnamed protein product [Lepeophtheirus salmonis]
MHGFQLGRIPEGLYEYNKLNGFMKADEAVDICNLDPECAGFTYRGLLPGNNHGHPRDYKMFFFRFVQSVMVNPDFLTWVSYCSFKNFGRIIGVPGNQSYESPHHVETLKDCTVSQYCAGVLIDSNENVLKTFSYIDLDTINRSQNQSNGILLINLVTEPHLLGQSQLDFMKFEQCCVQEKEHYS